MSDDIISIDVEFNADEVIGKLDKLKKALKDKTLVETLGQSVAQYSRERIHSGANLAPDGSQWESLAASTIRAKQKKGKGNMGILMQEPALFDRIRADPATLTEDSISIGSSLVYAMIHQKGGMAGPGRKVRIPARPYIGLSAEEKKLLEKKIANWIKLILED